uniref:Dolichol-phosphate mannosyltransferase subunit 3 n=1 Tax=Panagrolaimus sp. JU765 TaxID=591449 RepID=A0AC34RS12_9BILA
MVAEIVVKLRLVSMVVLSTYFVMYSLGYSNLAFFTILAVYLVTFAGYSAGRVAKMAYNFNPCDEAKVELENEIDEAKKHLSTIGL